MAEPVSRRFAPQDLGGYVLEAKLGQGGMGAVYRANHPSFPGKAFALKVLAGGELEAEGIGRFKREMQALAKVAGHPGIVKIHGGRIEGPTPYFVMELVSGQSLGKLVAASPLDPRRAATIVRHTADAIAHAHAQGVLHRDLKPDNVMVEAGDRPRVCDFGLAVLAGESRMTRSQASLGTATFSAPEQLDGRAREADGRADVYALGAILYATLTGTAPFEGSGAQLLKKVLMDPPPAPRTHVATIPEALELVCLKALEKEPARRYESVAAFRDDLDRWLAGEAVSVKPAGVGERLARGARRNRGRLVAGTFLVVLAIGTPVTAYLSALAIAVKEPPPGTTAEELVAQADRLDTLFAREPAGERRRRAARKALEEARALSALPDVAARLALLERTRETAELEAGRRLFLEEAIRGLRGDQGHARPAAELLPTIVAAAVPAATDLATNVADAFLGAHAEAQARAIGSARPDVAPYVAARLALRDAGYPETPGGPIALHGELAPATVAALVASRELPGVGRRAAWLLVDALACAGPSRASDAESAFGWARGHFPPESREERALALALAARPTGDGFSALRKALSPFETGPAAIALCRFFARAGAPDVVEYPHLLATPAAVKNALALDPPHRFDALLRVENAVGSVRIPGLRTPAGDPYTVAELKAGRAFEGWGTVPDVTLEVVENRIAAGLKCYPQYIGNLVLSADLGRGRLSAIPFRLLVLREALLGADDLACLFSEAERRDRTARIEQEHVGIPPFPAGLELAQGVSLPEALADFDRRLDAEVATDRLVKAALEGGEAGRAPLPRQDWDDALEGVKGLRRLEALVEAENLPETDRDRIAFDALVELDHAMRLRGPALLPFRTRLRALGLPRPVGWPLARLDLARLVEVGVQGPDIEAAFEAGFDDPVLGEALLLGAAFGVSLGIEEETLKTGYSPKLFKLAIAWSRERVICRSIPGDQRTRDVKVKTPTQEGYVGEASMVATNFGLRYYAMPLLGLEKSELHQIREITPELERRLSQPYTFDRAKVVAGVTAR